MATLRATQFASGLITGTAITNIYTVPAGHKAILKAVNLMEASGTSCVINVRLSAFGTFLNFPLNAYPASGSGAQGRPWIVLEAGQVLQLQRNNSGQFTYVVSGSLMTI